MTKGRARRDALLVLTCEHGGNAIPRRYRALFDGKRALLESHRGWDPGARAVAEAMAARFGAPLFVAHTSRLLVDLNRSRHHPKLFSETTRALTAAERERILREHYDPHRAAVEEAILAGLRRARKVVHVAVHSFTPSLDGVVRRADVGLLYDPRRASERAFTAAWRSALRREVPSLVVRLNYPYRGAADGFTTALRREHAASRYVGVELEMNQARLGSRAAERRMAALLEASLEEALG